MTILNSLQQTGSYQKLTSSWICTDESGATVANADKFYYQVSKQYRTTN